MQGCEAKNSSFFSISSFNISVSKIQVYRLQGILVLELMSPGLKVFDSFHVNFFLSGIIKDLRHQVAKIIELENQSFWQKLSQTKKYLKVFYITFFVFLGKCFLKRKNVEIEI